MTEVPLRRFPLHPAHPERICWGCHRYCPADAMRCGNGSERTQHPAELLGDDWTEFGLDAQADSALTDPAPAQRSSDATRTA